MLLLGYLAACGCPSFEEMEVTGTQDMELQGRLEAAIDDFAAWTGREGVCVPGIEVQPALWVAGEEVGAAYAGPHAWIRMGSDPGHVERAALHELCHAIDEQEGHSAAQPELFSGDDVTNDALYPTEAARRGEHFARSCASGGSSYELIFATDDLCGVSRWGFDFAYIQREIYSALPRPTIEGSGVSFTTTSRELQVGTEVEVRDAVRSGDALLLLAEWPTAAGTEWGLVQIEPASGARLQTLPLGVGDSIGAGAELVRSDGPALVLTGVEGNRALLQVDLALGSVHALVEGLDAPGGSAPAAWSEGVLYVTGSRADGTPLTTAWSEEGARALEPLAPGYAIAPVPGGVELYTSAGLQRYVGGAWVLVTDQNVGGPDVVPVLERWRLGSTLAGIGPAWVLIDAEDGSVGLPAECQGFEDYVNSWVPLGDQIWLVPTASADEAGQLTIESLVPV